MRRDLDVRSLRPECLPPGAQLPLRDGHRGAVAAEPPVGARERHLSSTPPPALHGGREVFASDPRAEPRWPRWVGRGAADNPARLRVPPRTELAGGGAGGALGPGRQAGGALPGARATSRRLPRPGRPGRGAPGRERLCGSGTRNVVSSFPAGARRAAKLGPWSAGREGAASPAGGCPGPDSPPGSRALPLRCASLRDCGHRGPFPGPAGVCIAALREPSYFPQHAGRGRRKPVIGRSRLCRRWFDGLS